MPSDRARLVVLSGTGVGRTCVVSTEVVIGRGLDVGLTVASGEVSRQHARVFRTGAREFSIADLGSRNGTNVNGETLGAAARVLAFGDKIQVGGAAVLLFAHFDPAEERLVQAQKLQSLGQLASGVAHDVNNLVGSVLGNLQYIQDGVQGNKDLTNAVKDSEEALYRVVDMVRRLMDFSRRGSFESRPVPVLPLVTQASHVMNHKSRTRAAVDINVPPELHVLGDSTQLLQVMTNLCSNAMDALPQGGTVTVNASAVTVGEAGLAEAPNLPPGQFVRIAVVDHGTGMTPEVMARLFEPFFTTKPVGKGTGLGLATVHGIVNNHGGHVGVTSQLGKGTTFVVHLPMAQALDVGETSPAPKWMQAFGPGGAGPRDPWAGETARVDAGTPQVASPTGPLILVVDDEPLMRRSTQRMLSRMGSAEVVFASDGEEAIALYGSLQSRITLVLMDINMPGKNGLEACSAIRALNPGARVVLASGSVPMDYLGHWGRTPGVAFLRKPFDDKALQAAMAAALGG
jgi:two-component system cell cycle sensor histidine kinase/response regulator CckA